jgi:hypothetical protein
MMKLIFENYIHFSDKEVLPVENYGNYFPKVA